MSHGESIDHMQPPEPFVVTYRWPVPITDISLTQFSFCNSSHNHSSSEMSREKQILLGGLFWAHFPKKKKKSIYTYQAFAWKGRALSSFQRKMAPFSSLQRLKKSSKRADFSRVAFWECDWRWVLYVHMCKGPTHSAAFTFELGNLLWSEVQFWTGVLFCMVSKLKEQSNDIIVKCSPQFKVGRGF